MYSWVIITYKVNIFINKCIIEDMRKSLKCLLNFVRFIRFRGESRFLFL